MSRRWLGGLATAAVLIGGVLAFRPGVLFTRTGHKVSFSREIRPILNQNCLPCHGGVRQKSGVSFLFREEALGVGKSGRPTIIPGKPDQSELIARVTATDPDVRMPYHAPPLPREQVDLLRRWIKQGAKWEDHWAFVPPKAQVLPPVKRGNWMRRPLDQFILARLEKEGLEPSAEADKALMLRRVSLDLTGLPPTEAELAAFLADSSPNAYDKQVDRLLASPGYGERWAALWLDLARYADTKGYEKDGSRPGVWPYRDWVIDALNRNLPYDKFVITQLAGDLLPNATFEDQIATSFHRQTPVNDEGGTDNEEYRLIAVMDRSATTWAVLNGLTMNCVQCHSHPYDPIRHPEYYKSLAFFNTTLDADLPEDTPILRVPKDRARYPEVAQLQQDLRKLLEAIVTQARQAEEQAQWKALPVTQAFASEELAIRSEAADYERELLHLKDEKLKPKEEAAKRKYLVASIPELKKQAQAKAGKVTPLQILDGGIQAGPTVPGRAVYELIAKIDTPVLAAVRIEVTPANSEIARHTPEDGFIVDHTDAWIVQPNGQEQKIPIRFWAPDSEDNLRTALDQAVKAKREITSDAGDNGFAANPSLSRPHWIVGIPPAPLKLLAPGSKLKVHLTQRQNINDKPALLRRARLFLTDDPRWSLLVDDPDFASKLTRITQLSRELEKIPTVELPVMSEEADYDRRATLEFERGNFLTKTGPALQPDVPGIFPKLPSDAPRNRLTLARWFFSPGQPLTARTAVNRYWEQLFGTGIVETLENFGSVGEEPSHPELLDWLALHFENDLHWDMKALLREMVTSATYRQSAKVTPALLERDPRNRLLARGPQQRLTAEMVRDQALMAAGLLSTTMGGPPVMPPQPAGVWNSVYNDEKWVEAKGSDRFRRAIYTFIKRTSGYPSFLTFDASDHDMSLARRIPTNTPLQALVTLNDPVYQEASEALATRMMKEKDIDARLSCGARLVLSREPSVRELEMLRSLFEKTRAMPVLRTVASVPGKSKDLAAMTLVASVLLNLDGALTR